MAEYIEREKVYDIFAAKQQKLLKYHRYYQLNDADKEEFDLYDSYMNEVESIPSADVVEVVHASWVWGKVCGSKGYCCTNCGAGFVGENAEWIAKEHDYCPKCGAKMDGERKSEDG